jgi:hypothetical protein
MTITKAKQIMALRSAVDLLSGAYKSSEYAEEILGDYKFGGKREKIAQSLYKLIDELEGK